MSQAEHEVAHAHGGHPPTEEDWVPTGRIVMVAVAALVVFLVGSVAAGLGMRSMQRKLNPEGPPPAPVEGGKPKIVDARCRSSDICQSNAAKVITSAMTGNAPAPSRRCFTVRSTPPSASCRTDQRWRRCETAIQRPK